MKKTAHRGVYEIGRGKYRIRAQGPDWRTGKRRERTATVEGSIRDAVARHEQLLAEITQPPRVRRTTLSAFADDWHRRKKADVELSTWKRYGEHLALHILPALGDMYVDALVPSMISDFVRDQLDAGHAKNSVTNRLKLLRQIAADTVVERYADSNWCARVKAPSETRYTDDEPNSLTADELRAVLAAVPPYWRALCWTLALTGQRWSSVTALKWSDFDAENNVLHFQRRQVKGIPTADGTGDKKGRVKRQPIHAVLTEILQRHRRRLVEDQHPGLESGWMFPTRTGGLHKGSPLRKVLREACEQVGVTIRFTTHGLRRTFNDLVTMHSERRVAMELVGHESEKMHEHYSTVREDEQRDVLAKVVELVKEEK